MDLGSIILLVYSTLATGIAIWGFVANQKNKVSSRAREEYGKDISEADYGQRILKIERASQILPTLRQISKIVETHKELLAILADDDLMLLRENEEAEKYERLKSFLIDRIRNG